MKDEYFLYAPIIAMVSNCLFASNQATGNQINIHFFVDRSGDIYRCYRPYSVVIHLSHLWTRMQVDTHFDRRPITLGFP